MVRSKAPSKKPQARGVDFKKFKKKLGRKLPPPKNATNIEIKAKAIILPEQSVALNKEGVAVSKKGLTLKELLHQTSHHNVKVRREALLGIRELLIKHPTELKLHKNVAIEKLRERISDDDKVVRETLYQLFKSVILPGCKEDIQGTPISLIMAYIFKAMTHLAIDVRFMAFKFFDLVVQNHPPAFTTYAEKVLDNYIDLLQKNQFYLEDKSNLKFSLSSLKRCLSLLPSNESDIHSSEQSAAEKEVLHAFERNVPKDSTGHILIAGKLKDLVPVLINCFYGLISIIRSQPLLDSHSFDCMLSILESIESIVQYIVYGIGKYQLGVQTSMSSVPSSEICIPDENFPSLLLDRLFAVFPMQSTCALPEEDDHHYNRRFYILNGVISQIFFTFNQHIYPLPVLCDRFVIFLKCCLSEVRSNLFNNAFCSKHLPSLIPFIPYLVSTIDDQEHQLLKAFTSAFVNCSPDSSLKMACLEAVEEMLVHKQEILFVDAGNKEILNCQRTWINEIGLLLSSFCNNHPSSSRPHVSAQQAVLHLLLRLGQIGLSNSDLAEEYDKLQDVLQDFYCKRTKNGPFFELPKDSQEVSICCLYYFSSLKGQLLASLALCCLSDSLDFSVLFRIMEVLHSSYKAGHVRVEDYISFLVTLLSQYEIAPEKTCSTTEKDAKIVTFRSVTARVCSFLSQMGDPLVLFQILEDVVLDLLSQRLPLENTHALMAMLITVYSRPTRLSEKSIIKLSDIIMSYMIDVALLFREQEEGMMSDSFYTCHYYLLPCFMILDRSSIFPKLLLDKMEYVIGESCDKITAIVSIFSMMSVDGKMRGVLTSFKTEIDNIFRQILSVQKHSSEIGSLNLEQQHKVQCAVERLRSLISTKLTMTS